MALKHLRNVESLSVALKDRFSLYFSFYFVTLLLLFTLGDNIFRLLFLFVSPFLLSTQMRCLKCDYLSLSLSPSPSHTHTHTLAHTHIHTHTHTNTHTITFHYSLFLFLSLSFILIARDWKTHSENTKNQNINFFYSF